MSTQRPTRPRKKSRAERLREACEGQYQSLNQEGVKEEIARLSKLNLSLTEDKKAEVKSKNDLIKDNKDKIEYLIGHLDALRHEVAVANQLEQAAE